MSYYDITHQRQFESFATEDEARRELAKRIAQVADGIPVTSKPHLVRFQELADDMLADMRVNRRRSYPNVEAKFRLYINPVFGRHRAMQITTAQLNLYITRRMDDTPKPTPGTINHELAAIRRAFKLALEGMLVFVQAAADKATLAAFPARALDDLVGCRMGGHALDETRRVFG